MVFRLSPASAYRLQQYGEVDPAAHYWLSKQQNESWMSKILNALTSLVDWALRAPDSWPGPHQCRQRNDTEDSLTIAERHCMLNVRDLICLLIAYIYGPWTSATLLVVLLIDAIIAFKDDMAEADARIRSRNKDPKVVVDHDASTLSVIWYYFRTPVALLLLYRFDAAGYFPMMEDRMDMLWRKEFAPVLPGVPGWVAPAILIVAWLAGERSIIRPSEFAREGDRYSQRRSVAQIIAAEPPRHARPSNKPIILRPVH